MTNTIRRMAITGVLLGAAMAAFSPPVAAEPLKIGYSDWPGWVAWEVAVEKKLFEKKGLDVDFFWFDYVASMDAFAAGKLDAVTMTNGDTLVTGATGAPSVMILINDYSNGNDMVVAKPGIGAVSELEGKKIGVEVGFVSHLLLLDGLKKAGLSESDVTLVNMLTNEAAQVLASGDVDAVVAWQPNSGRDLIRGSYRLEIEEGVLRAEDLARPLLEHAEEIEEVRGVRGRAFAAERERWRVAGLEVGSPSPPSDEPSDRSRSLPDGARVQTAPLAGSVWSVLVAEGDTVGAGDPVVVLESMKTEIPVTAPAAGGVAALLCRPGEIVEPGQPLFAILPD